MRRTPTPSAAPDQGRAPFRRWLVIAAVLTLLALAASPRAFAQPANDDCANAIAVVQGDIAFSTVGASTDGTDLVGFCDMGVFGDDNAYNDIWFTYTAIATGDVFLTTCNQADYDTRLAVYDSIACPADAADVIGCNDDVAGCALFTSEMTFAATAGSTYLIRVGAFQTQQSGTGTLTLIETAPDESAHCFDSVDNDGDGLIDCADPDCQFDTDLDGTPDCNDGCPNDPAKTAPGLCGCGVAELDTDADGICDEFDLDDDGDGVDDLQDSAPLNPFVCRDLDGDSCDDCSSGTDDVSDDGTDTDGDGLCDAGDPDDDNDGVLDGDDPAPLNAFSCGDSDLDSCDDCVSGSFAPAADGTDSDGDGLCDAGDGDDDGDGVADGADPQPLDPFLCGDSDGDSCDDCSVAGAFAPANDGVDTDSDGLCDAGDSDDDDDGISDGVDPAPLDAFICGDSDGDSCDDCSVAGTFAPTNDGTDTDSDGLCDAGDPDDDGDGIADGSDPAPLNAFICGDSDLDSCDDCSVAASFAPGNDGADFDSDGLCDVGDDDDDNDGVADSSDPAPFNAFACGDADGDTCDDCTNGGFAPQNDGPDTDSDGLCDAGDLDDDGDGVADLEDPAPLDPFSCGDSDGDTCDDCVTGTFAVDNDGVDSDADGLCDAGDDDDDNDGITDSSDPEPLNPFVCGDSDGDTCDDCVTGSFAPNADGTDADGDGLCDAGDADDDNDTIPDFADPAPLNAFICGDSDSDTCDDCVSGTFAPSADGTDTDADGLCNAGDADDDSDGVVDGADPSPLDPFVCGDSDGDGCEDCSSGSFDPANDGPDLDADGICDVSDPDQDGDGVADTGDLDPTDPTVCQDADGDGCDDCTSGTLDLAADGPDNDGDGLCDAGDPDDDNDGVVDTADSAPFDPTQCGDSDGDTCDDCASGVSNPTNDGVDTDSDGLCDVGDLDDDGDTILDVDDPAPLDAFVCGDADGDGCDDCVSGTSTPAADGTDTDADGLCDLGDLDDDGDGVLDVDDPAPLDAFSCGDSDGDGCDDCSSGSFSTATDGTDTDGDGLCDAGDLDDDDDTVLDVDDPEPLNAFVCGDADGDTCDDCVTGTFAPSADGTDTDSDGLCDAGDPDDDNDGVADFSDSAPLDPFTCGDVDGDTCDDCSSGTLAPAADGLDTDGDGLCDAGDLDDDGDGVTDAADPAPLDAFVCGDSDSDGCDDCVSGTFAPNADGVDTDADGLCDLGDSDDDDDGIADGSDPAPLDAFLCGDTDGDSCDDCAVSGTFAPANDGVDSDSDGLCDAGDADDDNDGVLDSADSAPLDPNACSDSDGDGCDDCASGTFAPNADGVDTDADGLCDAGDSDDDNDGVVDGGDLEPLNAFVCGDSDADGCDDCSTGTFDPGTDGTDTDSDGICDTGDSDDDGDGVDDTADSAPLDPFLCADSDGDGCDDCSSGTFAPNADGADNDADGLCDSGDPDDDNDGVLDGSDTAPFDAFTCGDSDADSCDDCSSGSFDPANDGPDLDADGVCDAGDSDTDNDGVIDSQDVDPTDNFSCSDVDADGCDDCSSGTFDLSNDGADLDGDGLCDTGDLDDDGDGIADATDPAPQDAFICGDSDNDTCDDCSVTGTSDPANDGPDADLDGICDAGDNDSDGDGVVDTQDSDPNDPFVCSDLDGDGCEDCASGTFDPATDGLDTDADGLCDLGDPDDDNDGVLDGDDGAPLDPNLCGDVDADGCDDCASGAFDAANDGLDTDSDGLCDLGDPDDDGDGVLDGDDPTPLDPTSCGDSDLDGCDDCVNGVFDPTDDGVDTDADGLCDAGDPDDDGDGVLDGDDSAPLDAFACGDSDLDGCDDCVTGTSDPASDGLDTDADGICDLGDDDLDGDGVANGVDPAPLDAFSCGDSDGDSCDDCVTGTSDPANDGVDTDADGLCDAGDTDDDGDGVLDGDDPAPLDAFSCGDSDGDTCDDCVSGTFAPSNDGTDTDSDGLCDAGDADVDGDGVENGADSDPLNTFACGDLDLDGCDDCVNGSFDPSGDGLDSDSDGLCDVGDLDDDGDGVADASDSAPLDPFVCADIDNDGCDDCSSGTFDTLNDGPDADMNGICDGPVLDNDSDGVPNDQDLDPNDPFVCQDLDLDGCDDCSSGVANPANDGLDTDQDGLCNAGDPDDDGDGTVDAIDGCPLDPLKTAPGPCGCGELEIDSDLDGTPDCNDGCPFDDQKLEPGDCGCNIPDEDLDLDGVSDCLQSADFTRADMNVDGQTNIADPIFLLNFLFQTGTAPQCFDATDANDDGLVDVSDVIYFITWVFSDGPEPPAPFGACGQDPTEDGLACETFGACP